MTPTNGSAAEFDGAVEHLEDFGIALKGLITELLRAAGVSVHSVDFRVKGSDSAEKKLSRNEEKYSGYSDLKDLLGIRVITYFPDEVDKVAKVLRREFDIDKENSVDKRTVLDPDRFGYLSLHYVAGLNSRRAKLVEYQRYEGRCFELQIRSILQHAWAEIEHDLGYKSEGGVPRDVRRRFSRLAGLLELADDEFATLRRELQKYERKVEKTIVVSPAALGLDQSTLQAFLNTAEAKSLDSEVAGKFPAEVRESVDPSYAGKMALDLSIVGVPDIQTLTAVIESHREHVVKFAEIWLGGRSGVMRREPLARGIGLFYLVYTLIATADDSTVDRWNRRPGKRTSDLVERVREAWAQVVSEIGEPDPLRPEPR